MTVELTKAEVGGQELVRGVTAVPDSCTSMARAHCFYITTMTFEAQYHNETTFAEKDQTFIRINMAISVGLSA